MSCTLTLLQGADGVSRAAGPRALPGPPPGPGLPLVPEPGPRLASALSSMQGVPACFVMVARAQWGDQARTRGMPRTRWAHRPFTG